MNEIILNYLREHLGKFRTEDLKQKILSRGYTGREFEEALSFIETQERILAKKKMIKGTGTNSFLISSKSSVESPRPKRGLFFIGLFSLVFLVLAILLTTFVFFEPLKVQKLSDNLLLSFFLIFFSIFGFSLLQNIGFFIIGKRISRAIKISTSISFLFFILMLLLILSRVLFVGLDGFLLSGFSFLLGEASPLFLVGFFSVLVLWVLSKIFFAISIIRSRNRLKNLLFFSFPLLIFLIVFGVYLGLTFYLAINVSLLTRVLLDLAEGMPRYLILLRGIGIFALSLWGLSLFGGANLLLRASGRIPEE